MELCVWLSACLHAHICGYTATHLLLSLPDGPPECGVVCLYVCPCFSLVATTFCVAYSTHFINRPSYQLLLGTISIYLTLVLVHVSVTVNSCTAHTAAHTDTKNTVCFAKLLA